MTTLTTNGRRVLEEESDPRSLFAELKRRIESAQVERSRHERQWSDNHKMLIGDHRNVFNHLSADHHYFVVNRVRSIVDTHVAIMTETPARILYEPHEVGEPPDWLLRPEALGKLEFAAERFGDLPLTPEQMQGADFIDDATARMLLGLTVPQQQEVPTGTQHPETGEPQTFTQTIEVPIFTEDDFWIVDNQLEADALTQEVMGQWRNHAHGDESAVENIFEAQVVGHCDMIVQWDGESHSFSLSNLYPYNVWIAPWSRDTTDAEYYIVREFLPVSEARSLWPQHAEYIEQHSSVAGSSSGLPSGSLGGRMQHAGTLPMIPVYTWWQRHHPFEREPDDAVERGLVVPAVEEVQSPVLDPETGEPLIDPETDGPLMELSEEPVVTDEGQQVYQLIEDGEPGAMVMPGDLQWPKRYGIRQLMFLHDMLVFDAESDFVDIPAGRTKAMIIQKSPYGQGEPQRVAELVDLYNRLFSIYHDYFKYFRSPEQAIPASVYEDTVEAVEQLHSSAARKWVIRDSLWMQFNGDVLRNYAPPQLGSVIAQMMEVVDRAIDKVSGINDVIRGETKSDQSGDLFRRALEAARGPIGLKARNFSDALRHVARIIARLVIDFLPPEVWAERNRKYPVQVFTRIQERLRRHGVHAVPEVSGTGTREEKIRHLQELWSAGVQTPTVLQNLVEQLGVADAHKITQEWQQQMAAGTPQ